MLSTSVLQALAKLWERLAIAPERRPPLEPPSQEGDVKLYGIALDRFHRLEEQRKTQHDEASKTIRRTFQGLVVLCLFCAVTLAGSPDINLLTPEAIVTLPGLNYPMSFTAFLVIGPVVLTAWGAYLHILWAEHRRSPVSEEGTAFPTLFNMPGTAAKVTTGLVFYWLVPLMLAYFAWTALPRLWEGLAATLVAAAVTAALVWLQVRRCPSEWRWLAYPALFTLVLGCATVLGLTAWSFIAEKSFYSRSLQLFKADLQKKDLRRANLRGAYLVEARLDGADLSGANLSGANLSGAKLVYADLVEAILVEANLSGADMSEADMSEADLRRADLTRAKLVKADLRSAILVEANLELANLSGANLSGAFLSGATWTDGKTKCKAGSVGQCLR